MHTLECAPSIGAEEDSSMKWLNVDVELAKHPEFFGAPPVDRATWFCLMLFCAANENGGRISGCKGWGTRKWFSGALITLDELQHVSELWRWEGDDLVVKFYPIDQEERMKQNRLRGKAGAEARWGKTGHSDPNGEANTESKVKEGKGREGKDNAGVLPAWRRLKGLEDELTEIKGKLQALSRPDPNIFPEQYKAVQEQAEPLRARRDELKQLIAQLQKVQPNP